MKGRFEYIGADYNLHRCNDSDEIPHNAKEMVLFSVAGPEPPHTEEDHRQIAKIQVEFNRIKEMIYGAK